jgi:hypothetical protein
MYHLQAQPEMRQLKRSGHLTIPGRLSTDVWVVVCMGWWMTASGTRKDDHIAPGKSAGRVVTVARERAVKMC